MSDSIVLMVLSPSVLDTDDGKTQLSEALRCTDEEADLTLECLRSMAEGNVIIIKYVDQLVSGYPVSGSSVSRYSVKIGGLAVPHHVTSSWQLPQTSNHEGALALCSWLFRGR
jgi:hypothetical protein